MSSIWDNSATQESLFQAINRQRTLLERHVGPLELFRDGWSPNNKALMDIMYGLSTVLGFSPIRFMVSGFLQREMAVVGLRTPLAELAPEQRSSLLSAFVNDVRDGEMEWQLRSILTRLKSLEVSNTFERRISSALASGVLSGDHPSHQSKKTEPNEGSTLQDMETTVVLTGSILFLIYVLNLLIEERGLPDSATQPSVIDLEDDQVIKGLLEELVLTDTRVKGVAFSALGQIGDMREEVVEALLGHLDSENTQDRRNAAWAISRNISGGQAQRNQKVAEYINASPDLLSALKRAINDPVPRVARNAALALGGLGPFAMGVSSILTNRISDPNLAPTFEFTLACIQQPSEKLASQLAERIGREDPLLDIGLRIDGRDFGGFDNRGGGAMCMCTFS